jgi:hypothetical protein
LAEKASSIFTASSLAVEAAVYYGPYAAAQKIHPIHVLGTVRGDQGPGYREGRCKDRDGEDALVDQDLAQGTTGQDGEHEAARG